jgi:4-hydroxy 2-oxovalerate aldolase
MKTKYKKITHIDCTLRDGGYYNNWDFSRQLINEYAQAMAESKIHYIELGFRSFDKDGFKGACAYTTDEFISQIDIPKKISVGVMVNASELTQHINGAIEAVKLLFKPKDKSPVDLVRIACHFHEFEEAIEACTWLKNSGYKVGINLMQISDRTEEEIKKVGKIASSGSIDVLYFADSLGSMDPEQTSKIIKALRKEWKGELGIHTHDNLGMAVANTLRAIDEGVSWIDSTVTGMGRGPGNAQTEYLLIERRETEGVEINIIPILELIKKYFREMQYVCGWGKSPYYYMAGKMGIHPTNIQEMLGDTRYGEAEIISVIEQLAKSGGKKFNSEILKKGREVLEGNSNGKWNPSKLIEGRTVLILGGGDTVKAHREAIERYIKNNNIFVIALNAQNNIENALVNLRAASYPVRILADCRKYSSLSNPLVIPKSRLTDETIKLLINTEIYDFGLEIKKNTFEFKETSAICPSILVISYALAVATSGKAKNILLAGFDGYSMEDKRNEEIEQILETYKCSENSLPILSVTQTKFKIPTTSIYAI